MLASTLSMSVSWSKSNEAEGEEGSEVESAPGIVAVMVALKERVNHVTKAVRRQGGQEINSRIQ